MMQVNYLDCLLEAKLIPVLRKISNEYFMDVVEALVAGGVRALEITMDGPEACRQIYEVNGIYGPDILVGAGTVINESRFEDAVKAGATFIVSPILDEGIISKAKKRAIPVIPGVFSPTEVVKAISLGAEMVKLFPAGILGPDYIKNIRGPLGDIPIMCTGGISAENAAAYIHAGAKLIGVGSSLIKNIYFETRNWPLLTNEASDFLQILTYAFEDSANH